MWTLQLQEQRDEAAGATADEMASPPRVIA
jgi:hypothetical protein